MNQAPLFAAPVAPVESDSWYTPPEIVDRVRRCLGRIELDPCSNLIAQTVVSADRYFTVDDDGLAQDWTSPALFVNPPYSAPAPWVDRLLGHWADRRIGAAILLVNNQTDSRWFQVAASWAAVICFPAGRISFWQPIWTPRRRPGARQGQAILYFGPDVSVFAATFGDLGLLVTPR